MQAATRTPPCWAMIGWGPSYGNTGFDATSYGGGISGQGFMRRKDNLWQWFSPNWGGLQMRVGWSNNSRFSSDESAVTTGLKTGNMVPMYENTDIGKTLRRDMDGSNPRYVTQDDVANVMTPRQNWTPRSCLLASRTPRLSTKRTSCGWLSAISSTMSLQLWS